eukprot:5180325-Prorocentrum_lima.AAC.1
MDAIPSGEKRSRPGTSELAPGVDIRGGVAKYGIAGMDRCPGLYCWNHPGDHHWSTLLHLDMYCMLWVSIIPWV